MFSKESEAQKQAREKLERKVRKEEREKERQAQREKDVMESGDKDTTPLLSAEALERKKKKEEDEDAEEMVSLIKNMTGLWPDDPEASEYVFLFIAPNNLQ
jgi:hypothetical protein